MPHKTTAKLHLTVPHTRHLAGAHTPGSTRRYLGTSARKKALVATTPGSERGPGDVRGGDDVAEGGVSALQQPRGSLRIPASR